MAGKVKPKVESVSDALMVAFLPIARTMIKSGFGVGELIHAAKLAYVHAAVREVTPAGSKLNVSRLSVATGLTRKEIAALLDAKKTGANGSSPKLMMEQRAFRVLRGWSIDPVFQRKDGRPADLEPRGAQATFSSLVKRYAGDVTPITVLRELERMKAIVVMKSGRLRLRFKIMDSRNHAAHHMTELAHLLKDFSTTVQQTVIPRERPAFFGFRDSKVDSKSQVALFQRVFSQRAAALLESMDEWIAHQTKNKRDKPAKLKSKMRIGLGIYLVQDE